MPQNSIHVDILKDNIFTAQRHPRCGNWAAGVMKQSADLGMPSPFSSSSSGITALRSLDFQANMEGQHRKVWDGLHVPKAGSVQGSKIVHILCMVLSPAPIAF